MMVGWRRGKGQLVTSFYWGVIMDRIKENLLKPFISFIKRFFPVISSTLFILLIVLFMLRIIYTKPKFVSVAINEDVSIIVLALEKIDKDCSILSFEHEHNFVDFLNVKSFSGSRVGSINLAYPQNWKGPYLKNNPTIQEKFYEVIKIKDELFVVPGKGIKLPNDLVIGKGIKFDKTINIEKMLKKGGNLNFKGKALGAKLGFTIGDYPRPKEESDKRLKEISKILKEFNEAMPFAFNKEHELWS